MNDLEELKKAARSMDGDPSNMEGFFLLPADEGDNQ